ncbi:hypothetical protein PV08_03798 [Exophiala spinifera]|uniref:Uncharacterized protein n=1 Tax=Exophiala spinifera TaxID=91928 RepID=A0A0D2BDD0_9EURO|nr:uncharacterized protein PV08_03798 [Exophiala spinifera]KIW16610.1 hypothetical protein PV08_03798 [Exophiala spinifera]
MWLLETETLTLKEFHHKLPEYAILSHRWEEEEMNFESIKSFSEDTKGSRKVKRFCQVALKRGYAYVWVDTCCIDKKSSAELNEAINSMYKWYSEAAICYVYLSDVNNRDDLEKSLWFTRGWTLQELLAPRKLHFFHKKWQPIASRRQLGAMLERMTSIPRRALDDFRSTDFCIAQKMSWAAHRETTRQEDRAYSLLGLFDVQMPLLYGEGQKAFRRLQEEIMKVNTDMSLFLWKGQPCEDFGMLAASPSCFSDIHDWLKLELSKEICELQEGWTVNNAGMRLSLSHLLTEEYTGIFVALLHEPYIYDDTEGMGIFLEKEDRDNTKNRYRRVAVDSETCIKLSSYSSNLYSPWTSTLSHIFISRKPFIYHQSSGHRRFDIRFGSQNRLELRAHKRTRDNPHVPLHQWPQMRQTLPTGYSCTIECTHAQGIIGHLLITLSDCLDVLICLGFDEFFDPFWVVVPLCGTIYRELRAWHIIRAFVDLPRNPIQDRSYDPKSGITALRATHGTIEDSWSDTGLAVQVSDLDLPGTYVVLIKFDADEFIQALVPEIEISSYTNRDSYPADVVERLRETEIRLSRSQRQRLLLHWR